MSLIVDVYRIPHEIPAWAEECFTEDIYRGILCESCDGFVYAECENYACAANEISRFQYYSTTLNATGLIVNGEPRGSPTCELPVIFTHHSIDKFYGHAVYYESKTDVLVLWKLLYHIHTWSMFFLVFGMLTLVIFRCKRMMRRDHGYSNVIVVGPSDAMATAPARAQPVYEEIQNTTAEACAICLSHMEMGESVFKLPCGHRYKKECITEWLTNEDRCPLCNAQTT